jgi:hypothetical protein
MDDNNIPEWHEHNQIDTEYSVTGWPPEPDPNKLEWTQRCHGQSISLRETGEYCRQLAVWAIVCWRTNIRTGPYGIQAYYCEQHLSEGIQKLIEWEDRKDGIHERL